MARFDSGSRLSCELLEQLYNGERLTIDEIAHRLGCGATTVARALRTHGFAVRSKRDYRLEISRDVLEQLYSEEGLTEDEIGQQFSCNGRTIGRRLEECDIPRRPTGSVPKYAVPPEVLVSWSADLAYAIGLLTADGNLNKDRSRVEFISTDKDLIDLYCQALRLGDIHVVFTPQQSRQAWYQVKLSDRAFSGFPRGSRADACQEQDPWPTSGTRSSLSRLFARCSGWRRQLVHRPVVGGTLPIPAR